MKKRFKIAALFMLVTGCSLLTLAGTTFLDWPSNGTYQSGIGPAKLTALDVTGGSNLTNGTVIIKRVTQAGGKVTTNDIVTVTCTNGVPKQFKITDDVWIFTDDVIVRSGTAADSRVRLIITQ